MKSRKQTFTRLLPLYGLIFFFVFSLCFRVTEPGFVPKETFVNLFTGVRFLIAKAFHQPLYLEKYDLIQSLPYYYETFIRLKYSLVTCLSGMGICLAGAAFQTMFRNPLASPNFIGISAGVNLGNVVFILVYTSQALVMLTQRYLYCYGFSVFFVLLIILAGKLAGLRVRRFSVMDMVIVGAVITQLGNVFVMYLQYVLEAQDPTLLLTYQELTMGIYLATDTRSLIFFAASILLGMLPLVFIRYRFNIAAFEEEDAIAMGIRPGRLRAVGIIFSGLVGVTAMIFCGDMGILALAVPHVCRYFVGSEFGRLSFVSICSGGILMLLCRTVSSLVYFQGTALPVNFIISLAVLPAFIVVLAKRKKAFE